MKTHSKFSLNRAVLVATLFLLTLAGVASAAIPQVGALFDPDGYSALPALTVASGQSITINSDTGEITGDLGTITSSTFVPDDMATFYRIFIFESIDIASGATVTITGDTPLVLASGADFALGADLSRSGAAGVDGNNSGGSRDGAAGEDGATLVLVADGTLTISSAVSVDGGTGGTGASAAFPIPNDGVGGDGGNGGMISLGAFDLVLSGSFSAKGGDDGGVGGANPSSSDLGDGGDGGSIFIAHSGTTAATTDVAGGEAFGVTILGTPFQGADGSDGTVTFDSTPLYLEPSPTFDLAGNISVVEDSGAASITGQVTNFDPKGAGQTISSYTVTPADSSLFDGAVTISNAGTLAFTPALNAEGSTIVTVYAIDTGSADTRSADQTFTITITGEEDVPTFTLAGDQTVDEDAGAQSLANFVTNFDPVEAGQTLNGYSITNSNTALFSSQPSLSIDGTLTYQTGFSLSGSSTVTVNATDSAGSVSLAQTFVITVNPVDDSPIFKVEGDVTVLEDAGQQSVTGFANSFSAQDAGQSFSSYTITGNTNSALFESGPLIDADGTLTFTTATNQTGSAQIIVQVMDTGLSNNTAENTFAIIVTPVDDIPTVELAGDITREENAGAQSIASFITSFDPLDEGQTLASYTVTVDSGAELFTQAPAISTAGVLSFTSVDDANGSATVRVIANDTGLTNSSSAPTLFTLTISEVNYPPTFTLKNGISTFEDADEVQIENFVIGFDANDPGQELVGYSLSIPEGSESLFASAPELDGETLRYTPASNASGSVEVTIVGQDSGLDNNTTELTFTLQIAEVNDRPEFSVTSEVHSLPVEVETGILNFLTDIDLIESGQVATITLSHDNAALFAVEPVINSSGTLTYTINEGIIGVAKVTVTVQDDGGTDNGGVDSRSRTFEIASSYSHLYDIEGGVFDPDAYASLGSLVLTNGQSMVIDVNAGTITGDVSFTSTLTDLDSHEDLYRIFNFDSIDIAAGSTVTVVGDGEFALALLSLGDFTLEADLSWNGADGADGGIVSFPAPVVDGGHGEEGQYLSLVAEGHLTISSTVSTNGGDGGDGGLATIGDDLFPFTGNAGFGADGGLITVSAYELTVTGTLSSQGGEGGFKGTDPITGNIQVSSGGGGEIEIYHTGSSNLPTDVSAGAHETDSGNDGDVYYDNTPRYIGVNIIYVNTSRTGTLDQDGESWDTAFADLQDALALAVSGDQIWVAAGIYYPDEAEVGNMEVVSNSRESTFAVPEGVSLYGSFIGTETSLTERVFTDLDAALAVSDSSPHFTVLSGDLEQNDGLFSYGIGTRIDLIDPEGANAYTVMTPATGARNITIDGFVFTGGIAQESGFGAESRGGALFLVGASPLVRNCIFSGNTALRGGAVYGETVLDTELNPKFISCEFRSNLASSLGGAIEMNSKFGTFAKPDFVSCHFKENESGENGGAVYFVDDVSPRFEGCAFTGNQAAGNGGAIMLDWLGNESLNWEFRQCTFAQNQASVGSEDPRDGGAIYIDYNPGSSDDDTMTLDLFGTLIYDNEDSTGSTSASSSIALSSSSTVDMNCYASLIQGYLGSSSHNPSEGEGAGQNTTGNLDGTDSTLAPVFLELIDFAVVPVITGDFRVQGQSSTVNAGDAAYLPADRYDLDQDGDVSESLPLDLNGQPRLNDGAYDIGAYEYHGPSIVNPLAASYDLEAGAFETLFDLEQVLSTVSGLSYTNSVDAVGVILGSVSSNEFRGLVSNDVGASANVILLITQDSDGEQIALHFAVTIVVRSGLDDFRLAYGLDVDGSQDFTTFNASETPNIFYYAFGLGDPSQANPPQVDPSTLTPGFPIIAESGGSIVFDYVRRKESLDNGISYTLYCSENLSDWFEVSLDPGGDGSAGDTMPGNFTVTEIDSEYEIVEVDFIIQGSGRFFRVGVTVE